MPPRSDGPPPDWAAQREQFLGLNESFSVKSYYPQLKELLEDLETKVKDRTSRLEEAIRVLKDAQDRLVMNEKMATLGRLAAGVSHELNSPLAAVESLSSSLYTSIAGAVAELPDLIRNSEPDLIVEFSSLLEEVIERALLTDGLGDRKRRMAIAAELEGLGLENAHHAAEAVDALGLHEDFRTLLRDFGPCPALRILSMLSAAAEIVRAAAGIRTAAGRAAVVVRSLGRLNGEGIPDGEAAHPPVDVDEVIAAALELYHNRIRYNVTMELALEAKASIRADSASLSQVFLNLIANALQAMDYRGTLGIRSRRDSDRVLVEIRDSGSGISDEDRERIFSPFFTTKPVGEGTGFGLVVAKRIVEDLGGSIRFESRPGKTVFTVELPCGSL